MFEAEQQQVEQQILAYCKDHGLPEPRLSWGWIPFNGHWGIATSFFQLAAQEARESGAKVNVGLRANELAEQVAAHIGLPIGFEKVEAVKGYLSWRRGSSTAVGWPSTNR
jgi:arginyl-tRNA synthetase